MGKKRQLPDTQVQEIGGFDSCLGVGDIEPLQSVPKRNNCPGIRFVGSRIYDSKLGKTCHQCRQKTLDFTALCKNVRVNGPCLVKYCHKCLLNRYGEKAEEVDLLNDWKCPKCQGICNCSVCMNKRGTKPTGNLVLQAKRSGFHSVSDMLNVKDKNELTKQTATVIKKTVLASPGYMGKENYIDGNSNILKHVPSLNPKPVEKKSKRKKWGGFSEMHTSNRDGETFLKKTMHKKSEDVIRDSKDNDKFTKETAAVTKETVLAQPGNMGKENNFNGNGTLMINVLSLNQKSDDKKSKIKRVGSTEMHTSNQDGEIRLKKTMHKKIEDVTWNIKNNDNFTKDPAAVTKEMMLAPPGNMGKENNIIENCNLMKHVPNLNPKPNEKKSKGEKRGGSAEMNIGDLDKESSLKMMLYKKSEDVTKNTKDNNEFIKETTAVIKETVPAPSENMGKENHINGNNNLMKHVPSFIPKPDEKKLKRKRSGFTEMHTGNQDGESIPKKSMHKKSKDVTRNTKDNNEFKKEAVHASPGNMGKESNIDGKNNLMKHVPSLNHKPVGRKLKRMKQITSTETHIGNWDGKSSMLMHKENGHETRENDSFLVEHKVSNKMHTGNLNGESNLKRLLYSEDKAMENDIHLVDQSVSFMVSSDENEAKHSTFLEGTKQDDEEKNSSTCMHALEREDMDVSDAQSVLKKSSNHSMLQDINVDLKRNCVADIKLPEGMDISIVAEIELPSEYVGDALQFLEFCAAFKEKLNITEGLAKSILRELLHGQRSRRSQHSSAIQFQMQLLSLILQGSGKELLTFDSGSGRNSWLHALDECVSESQYPFKESASKSFKQGGYDMLDSLQKLKLLNFLCDESLETVDMRTWIEDQNKIFLAKKKEAREKVFSARDNVKCVKQKFQEEITKAIIAKNGAPLSIAEHDVIASEFKAAVQEAEAELSKAISVEVMGIQGIYVVRTSPILLTDNCKVYWRLNSYTPKPHILLQELDFEETIVSREKWSTFTMEQISEIEKFISLTRKTSSITSRIRTRSSQKGNPKEKKSMADEIDITMTLINTEKDQTPEMRCASPQIAIGEVSCM